MNSESRTATASHTLDPWRYSAGRIFAGVGFVIADIHVQGACTIANARLIAAAPDMLAALHDLLVGNLSADDCTCEDCAKWTRARAAIAKATGGTVTEQASAKSESVS